MEVNQKSFVSTSKKKSPRKQVKHENNGRIYFANKNVVWTLSYFDCSVCVFFQHLTVKEDKLFGKPTLRDILEAIDNDHCYTVKRVCYSSV